MYWAQNQELCYFLINEMPLSVPFLPSKTFSKTPVVLSNQLLFPWISRGNDQATIHSQLGLAIQIQFKLEGKKYTLQSIISIFHFIPKYENDIYPTFSVIRQCTYLYAIIVLVQKTIQNVIIAFNLKLLTRKDTDISVVLNFKEITKLENVEARV